MTDEEESSLQAVTASKTVLNQKQLELLEVFDQLPEVEQDRFIELARTRLEELDRFMAEFLSKRKIPSIRKRLNLATEKAANSGFFIPKNHQISHKNNHIHFLCHKNIDN